jgi:hypothetical protein
MSEQLESTEVLVEKKEIRIEIANVDNIGSLEDEIKDEQEVTKSRCRKLNKWKTLATRKRIIRRAFPAVRKGHIRKRACKVSFTRGIPNERTLEIMRRTCQNEVWNHTPKEELSQWMLRTSILFQQPCYYPSLTSKHTCL